MSENGHATKELSREALDKTVQSQPLYPGSISGTPGENYLTIQLANAADEIWPWGLAGRSSWRDSQLRQFWPTEPTLAGAITTIASRNAALSWKLDGPTRTVEAVQDIFHGADLGQGWISLMIKLTLDLLTQDNGAFLEVARESYISGERALALTEKKQNLPPVVGISQLDAGCCVRTGHALYPVRYRDPDSNEEHLLPWHMVVPMSEMPSPVKRMRGMQYCAVTRILRTAQTFRDYGIYKHEKISGRFAKALHIVGGPAKSQIDDIMAKQNEGADNAGLTRYMMPYILASLDPTKPVSHVEIALASLPDGFDFDAELRAYITQLALAFLEDYQTFAPLPGGGLGTSQQSVVLAMKGRGKGVGLFMKGLTHIFNFWGILPRTVQFTFDEPDPLADKEKADLQAVQIANVVSLVSSGLMAKEVARQYMADEGIIFTEDYLAMQGEEDATPDETATDEEPVDATGDITPITGPLVQPEQIVDPAQPPQPNPLQQAAAQGVQAVKGFFGGYSHSRKRPVKRNG